jgi:formylglycine-generating enzyme required for sulfatase activity
MDPEMAVQTMVLPFCLVWVMAWTASYVAYAQFSQPERDCDGCPDMVLLPAGAFSMGSPDPEAGRDADEGPQHGVTIARPFSVGRFEVTRGQFAAFVAASGHQAQGGNCWYWNSAESKYRNDDPAKTWRNPGYAQTDTHPVVCVSWSDAKAYANWLSGRTGKTYRLLSEAEWEYAARAGAGSSRPWGDDPNLACRHANIRDQAFKRSVPAGEGRQWSGLHGCDDNSAYTADVGSYQRNAFGLHDMIGNVWEWTEDCANASYAGAPGDASAWLSGDCAARMVRGGSWYSDVRYARSTNRNQEGIGGRNWNLGFRLARNH